MMVMGLAFHRFLHIPMVAEPLCRCPPPPPTSPHKLEPSQVEPTEHDERLVRFGLETREGGRATAGYAGLARSAESALAPWERPGEPPSATPTGPDDDPLPDEPIGTAQPPRMIMLPPEITASRRAAAGDRSPWYTESSPWGGRIVPTASYIVLVWAVSPDSARSEERPNGINNAAAAAGMNGTFQLLQTRPMFADQPYELRSHLAEKGFSGRTAFRTMEHTIHDRDQRRVAAVRQKVRWFPVPASQ